MPFNTPILLIVYNRINTLSQVINSLKSVHPNRIYISSDGPKENRLDDFNDVENVRNYLIKAIDWECELHLNYRLKNEGLKKAFVQGVDWFFSKEEYGIILEDDIIPNITFFSFAEENLLRFRNESRIMMISGNNFLEPNTVKEDYYFSKIANIWGWATWRRAWRLLDIEMINYDSGYIKELKLNTKTNWIYRHHKNLYDAGKTSPDNIWDIQWYFSCNYNNGLILVPKYNLCKNIGYIGTNFSGTTRRGLFLETIEYEFNIKDPVIIHHSVLYDFNHHKTMHKSGVYIKMVIDAIKFLKLYPVYRTCRQILSTFGVLKYEKG